MNKEECIKVLKNGVSTKLIRLLEIEFYGNTEAEKKHAIKKTKMIEEAIKYLESNLQ